MQTKLYFFIGALCLGLSFSSIYAQQTPAYQLTLSVKGLKVPQVYLGSFNNGNRYTVDTAEVDQATGKAQFKFTKMPPQGMYYLAVSDQAAFDFVVNGEKALELRSDVNHLLDSLHAVGSKENAAFISHLKYLRIKSLDAEKTNALLNQLRNANKAEEVIREQQVKLMNISKEVSARSLEYQKKNPKTFTAKLLLASQNPQVPAIIVPYIKGEANPAYFQYIKNHYWDGYDFKESRLLRSTVFVEKLTTYFNQLVMPQPDTMKNSADKFLKKTKADSTTYRFALRWITNFYDNLERYAGDVVFTHVFDAHYKSARAVGVDTATFQRIKYKADLFRQNLTGNIATDIQLPDRNGVKQSLLDVEAQYTLLYFFSPLCSHCQKVTPELHQMLLGVDPKVVTVFSVVGEEPANLSQWKDYVATQIPDWISVADSTESSSVFDAFGAYNLPVIHVLNREKRIVAKYVKPENLKELIAALVGVER
jgi:peroxiredoxin